MQTRHFLQIATMTLVCLLGAVMAASAQVSVNASVDQDTIGRGDMVELTVRISGARVGDDNPPVVPNMQGFEVVSTSTSQSVSIINGQVGSQSSFIYMLMPKRSGKLQIPPIAVTVRGRRYATQPISVTVTGSGSSTRNQPLLPQSGSNPFSPGPLSQADTGKAVLVRQSVGHKTAYVGQQITYTFSFMQSEQLYGEVEYAQATTSGFVVEDLPNPPQSMQTVNNRPYNVQRRMKALFPTAPGKYTIGKASVTVTTDPLIGAEELVADPITITVLPLPAANRPSDFTGAVGSFQASVSVDGGVVRAGETLNCRVEIRGTGNIKSLGAPQLKAPASVRVYKAGEKRNAVPGGVGTSSSTLGGVATFTYLLLPREAGSLTIPSVHYPYFDAEQGVYRYAESKPIVITVTPGTGGATTAPVLPTDDLRPVKANPGRPMPAPVTGRLWFWLSQAIPLALVLVAGWRRWEEHRVIVAPDLARSGSALGLARRRFDLATRSLDTGGTDPLYSEVNAALADYIADRTGAPPAGLTADTAKELLLQHGADPALADKAYGLLSRSAAGRFAPGGAEAGNALALVREARELVDALQRQVRPHDEE